MPALRTRALRRVAAPAVAAACALLAWAAAAASAAPLAFDLPSKTTLRSSPKLVFAHYFTPYPVSLDDKAEASDYYTRNYLSITGESNKHEAYGGLLRDRPVPRAPIGAGYQVADMRTEVRRAAEAGLDGFTVDVLNVTGTHWTRINQLIDAAEAIDPGFKIQLMPDMTSMTTQTDAQIAAAMAELAASPSVMRLPDGRLVLSPFGAEKRTVAWWQGFLGIMEQQYGIRVALVPCFVNWSPNFDPFAPISYGLSNWGSRSTGQAASLKSQADRAHGLGKLWMQPVSAQDSRPNQGWFTEASATQTLRETFEAAVANADWVQIPTWNDYSENSHVSPSVHAGRTWLDLTSYYTARWKTGSYPQIKRDVLYLTHRVQPWQAQPTYPQTKLMALAAGSKPARDVVEVLGMLTAPGTIEVNVGGTVTTHAVAAGLVSVQVPLGTGAVGARLVRSGAQVASVQSPWAVTSAPERQEMLYRSTDSVASPGAGDDTDATPPAVAFTAPAAGATVSGSVAVTANASDAYGVTSVRLRVDGALVGTGTAAPWSFTWNASGASAGAHVLELEAVDAAGNLATATRTVNVPDATAPTVAFTAPASSATVGGSVAVTATASDAVGVVGVQLLVDGAPVATDAAAPWSFTWDASGASAGTHQLKLVATDAAGNSGSATRTVLVSPAPMPAADTTAPVVTITDAPAGGSFTTGPSVTVRFTADEPAAFQCRVDTGTWAACTSPAAFGGLSAGSHTLQVRAFDASDNLSQPVSRTWYVLEDLRSVTSNEDGGDGGPVATPDRTAPVLRTSGTRSGSRVRRPAFVLAASATDAGGVSRVEVLIGGRRVRTAAQASARWVLPARVLRAGRNVVVLRAFDEAGNVGWTRLVLYR